MSTIGREKRKEYEPFAGACVHGELPACSVACPLNLDVREIVRHIQHGSFNAAYKAYRVKAVFPEIVANLCDEPCKAACVRKDLDQSIGLRLLEKACVDHARSRNVPNYNLPPRTQRIAVIGAGLSGLACAVKLAAKSYPVTVYEKSERIGGRLWSLLDPEIFLPALHAQLDATTCDVRLGVTITSPADLAYDALVVATGAGGEDFGLLDGLDLQSFGSRQPGVFLVGSLLGTTPVEDIAQGRIAAFSAEKYLKVGAMDGTPETFRQTECKIVMDLSRVETQEAVPVHAEPGEAGEGNYDEGEAQAEAGRCLLCDCTICSNGCELFGALRRMPKQMVADAMASLHTKRTGGAARAMSSCNLCGLCGKVCPQGIDMGHFYTDFRVFKQEDATLPPAFHQFFMLDMQHANEEAYLARTAPGHDRAGYAFFPGCQLGASDPRHVALTYHHLRARIPDMALILGCCGAPAEWAAETELRDEVSQRLLAEWERFGRPTFVFACATCRLQFERHMPDIPATSLYELLLQVGLPEPDVRKTTAGEHETWTEACVFDPCSSRYDESMRLAVRRLSQGAGLRLTELPYSGETAQCCGWGGHIAVANPSLLNTIVENRTHADPRPYITYCANCQEVFGRRGKASRHILDFVLGLDATEQPSPSLGQRRSNRMEAKRTVLEREWGETVADMGDAGKLADMAVSISDELLAKMYDDRILEDDVYRTIAYCEETGNAVYDPERDLFIGHLRSGVITYWVEYRKSDEGYALSSVFTHRVEILEH
jgi:Fe-S oxidoreductase